MSTTSINQMKWFVAASFILVAILVIAALETPFGEPAQFVAAFIGA